MIWHLQEIHFKYSDMGRLKVKEWENVHCANTNLLKSCLGTGIQPSSWDPCVPHWSTWIHFPTPTPDSNFPLMQTIGGRGNGNPHGGPELHSRLPISDPVQPRLLQTPGESTSRRKKGAVGEVHSLFPLSLTYSFPLFFPVNIFKQGT